MGDAGRNGRCQCEDSTAQHSIAQHRKDLHRLQASHILGSQSKSQDVYRATDVDELQALPKKKRKKLDAAELAEYRSISNLKDNSKRPSRRNR